MQPHYSNGVFGNVLAGQHLEVNIAGTLLP